MDLTVREKAHQMERPRCLPCCFHRLSQHHVTEKLTGFDHEHCLDPGTNTLAGTWYLKKLLKRYTQTDNPSVYALADYNAGRGNVLKWNTGEAATNSAAFIEQIGFPGTKAYVNSVMQRYDKYHLLFAAK